MSAAGESLAPCSLYRLAPLDKRRYGCVRSRQGWRAVCTGSCLCCLSLTRHANFCMTSLTAGGVACRISTPFTDQTATTEQFDNLATRRAGVPPLDHVSVRRRAKFFFILTDQTATTEQGTTAGYFSHEGLIIAAASKMALLLLSKRTSTNG